MDFASVPPEITSALMYAGPGSGPLLAAASAWNLLSAELEAAAEAYEAQALLVVGETWQGPASEIMAERVTPYIAWQHATAAQAAQAATQAHAAAAAYEAAFAGVVPPPVIAENRARLLQLIATNFLGQNTPAIAETQAEYAAMWAQDAAAMYQYSAAASAATQVTPFRSPEDATNPAGVAHQAAATTQAAANSAGNSTQDTLAGVPQLLQHFAAPAETVTPPVVTPPVVDAGSTAAVAGIPGLSASAAYHNAIASVNFFQRLFSQFAYNEPKTDDIKELMDRVALATGAVDSQDELDKIHALPPYDPFERFRSWENWRNFFGQFGSIPAFKASAMAGMGQAATLSSLSVPQAWAAALPEPPPQLVSAGPAAVTSAATAPAAPGVGAVGTQAGLAGVAGHALATALTPRGLAGKPAGGREESKVSAEAAKEIAAALREYAALRDSGIITETEFNKHKERLMSLDPLSGR